MQLPDLNLSEAAKALTGTKSNVAAYEQGEGPVRYMDGSTLSRPFDLPRSKMPIALAIAAVAAVIGILLAFNVLGNTIHAAQRNAASVEENLAREVSLDLPAVTQYAGMDAASILQSLQDSGLGVYSITTEEELASGTLDAYKLPSDVSVEEAASLYAQGVSNLSGPSAALILNGSWRIQLDPADGFNLSVRYADFTSGNLGDAIEAAIAAEGFDSASASELDTDSAGNSYRSGTVDANGTTYNWRISAIALSEVYDISGLPDTAVYVGIRLTNA